MFRGLTNINLDAKGRLAIPSRYRGIIKEESDDLLVITIDTEDRCLLLYSYPQWEEIEQKLEQLPSFHPATRRIQRLLMGHATELEVDRNGRILLPAPLREYAGLEKTVVLVGQGNKFEVWGEGQWNIARDGWLAEGIDKEELPADLKNIAL